MNNKYPARRDFLLWASAMAAGGFLPRGALAQGAAAPLNFGYQTTSWGTIGMLVEAQDLFKKAGGNVTIHKFDGGKTTRDAMVGGRIDVGRPRQHALCGWRRQGRHGGDRHVDVCRQDWIQSSPAKKPASNRSPN